MTTKIYHNPRCAKSRAAVQLLDDRGIEYEVVKYLDQPPNASELTDIVQRLGIPPEQLVRKKEPLFKELGLGSQSLTNEEWIEVLAKNPKLIERPIVVHGKKAAIGRPTELIAKMLDA